MISRAMRRFSLAFIGDYPLFTYACDTQVLVETLATLQM